MGGRVFICTDDGPLVVEGQDCPNAVNHQPHPAGNPVYGYWEAPARRHLADYLETVADLGGGS